MKKYSITKVKCLCENDNDVKFLMPKIMKATVVIHVCTHCSTVWEFIFKNGLQSKKHQFFVRPKALLISQKCAKFLMTKREKEIQELKEKHTKPIKNSSESPQA